MLNQDENLPINLTKFLNNDKFVIFLFHGVIKDKNYKIRNYTGKHIDLKIFERCMKALNEHGQIISMDDVIDICNKNIPLQKKAFAITFDDGFQNNLTLAAPVLESLDINTTIYITTNFVELNKMSWIDIIEYQLEIFFGTNLEIDFFGSKYKINNKQNVILLLNEIRSKIKKSSKIDLEDFAIEFCEKNFKSYELFSNEVIDKKLSWKELKTLNKNKLFTIGGHTHNHKILSFINEKDLNFEINKCIDLLSFNLKKNILHFSYPEGAENCFNNNVIEKLKSSGIQCCPTAISGLNNNGENPFFLKRILVG